MLKWFWKYNKVLLVVFGVLLMISFTVGAVAMDTFIDGFLNTMRFGRSTTPGVVIGRLPSGERISSGDERLAARDREVMSVVLNRLGPGLEWTLPQESLTWTLLLRESEQAGLWASDMELVETLAAMGLNQPGELYSLLAHLNIQEVQLDVSLRHWLMIEKYRMLLTGQALTRDEEGQLVSPILHRLSMLATSLRMLQMGSYPMAQQFELMASGSPRISTSLIRHLVAAQQSRLTGSFVLISSDPFLAQVTPPDQAALQALFERYRDTFAGESEPYGFGYKFPSRIKIEAVTIPMAPLMEQVRPQIEDDFVAARRYYEQNRQQFPQRDSDGQATGRMLSFEQALPRVIERMTREQAQTMARRIGNEVRAQLLAPLENLPTDLGYRRIPDDLPLPAMADVVQHIKERFDVELLVLAAPYAQQWTAVQDVSTIARLGMTALADMPQVSLTQYLLSARELAPEAGNPLIPRRLQRGVPSDMMAAADGSLSVFRLVEAQQAHAPQRLEIVEDQVRHDALRKAAYEKLLAEQDQWLTRLHEAGSMEQLAEQLDGAAVLDIPAVNRRQPRLAGLPDAQGVVDAAFDLADELGVTGNVESMPFAQRSGVQPAARSFSLVAFSVDRFLPVTRGDFEQVMNDSSVGVLANLMIPIDLQWSPLSLDGTIHRTGFVYEHEEPGVEDEPDLASDQARQQVEADLRDAEEGRPF